MSDLILSANAVSAVPMLWWHQNPIMGLLRLSSHDLVCLSCWFEKTEPFQLRDGHFSHVVTLLCDVVCHCKKRVKGLNGVMFRLSCKSQNVSRGTASRLNASAI